MQIIPSTDKIKMISELCPILRQFRHLLANICGSVLRERKYSNFTKVAGRRPTYFPSLLLESGFFFVKIKQIRSLRERTRFSEFFH